MTGLAERIIDAGNASINVGNILLIRRCFGVFGISLLITPGFFARLLIVGFTASRRLLVIYRSTVAAAMPARWSRYVLTWKSLLVPAWLGVDGAGLMSRRRR